MVRSVFSTMAIFLVLPSGNSSTLHTLRFPKVGIRIVRGRSQSSAPNWKKPLTLNQLWVCWNIFSLGILVYVDKDTVTHINDEFLDLLQLTRAYIRLDAYQPLLY